MPLLHGRSRYRPSPSYMIELWWLLSPRVLINIVKPYHSKAQNLAMQSDEQNSHHRIPSATVAEGENLHAADQITNEARVGSPRSASNSSSSNAKS
jgi:hypothetical protein